MVILMVVMQGGSNVVVAVVVVVEAVEAVEAADLVVL